MGHDSKRAVRGQTASGDIWACSRGAGRRRGVCGIGGESPQSPPGPRSGQLLQEGIDVCFGTRGRTSRARGRRVTAVGTALVVVGRYTRAPALTELCARSEPQHGTSAPLEAESRSMSRPRGAADSGASPAEIVGVAGRCEEAAASRLRACASTSAGSSGGPADRDWPGACEMRACLSRKAEIWSPVQSDIACREAAHARKPRLRGLPQPPPRHHPPRPSPTSRPTLADRPPRPCLASSPNLGLAKRPSSEFSKAVLCARAPWPMRCACVGSAAPC